MPGCTVPGCTPRPRAARFAHAKLLSSLRIARRSGQVYPSARSVAYGIVNQLRDPATFEEAGRTYLLYSIAGERGIAIAQLGL